MTDVFPSLFLQNVYVNITRILGMAQRMCDSGHYASNMIRVEAGRLEREWKSLAAALEDRTTVLRMSVVFHKKAEQVTAYFQRGYWNRCLFALFLRCEGERGLRGVA